MEPLNICILLLIACLTTIRSDGNLYTNNNVIAQKRNANVEQRLQFDEKTCDFISSKVLDFAHDIGQEILKEQTEHLGKCLVFSPVSVMSVLSMLLLGAKGKSYQQLKQLFGFDNAELQNYPIKFHQEFAKMLDDLQESYESHPQYERKNAYWRNTETSGQNIRRGKTPVRQEHLTKIANGIFSQIGYNINPHYRRVITNMYHSEATTLDFKQHLLEARTAINNWAAEKTFGKIPIIINDEVTRDTNVVLASALYFKGFWENDFPGSFTRLQDFYPDGIAQPPIKVQMMSTAGVYPFHESVEYDCRIIGLPYQDNATTMYIIEPNNSTRTKLRELQKLLEAEKIEEVISKMSKSSAILTFPKMHFTHKIKMEKILRRLGITDVFTNGVANLTLIGKSSNNADTLTNTLLPAQLKTSQTRSGQTNFTNPTRNVLNWQSAFPSIDRDVLSLEYLESQRSIPDTHNSDLYVDEIIHKVDFEVNEVGTEAAAVTAATMSRSGPKVTFRADTPFLLLVRHDLTKLILFYGIIEEPVL